MKPYYPGFIEDASRDAFLSSNSCLHQSYLAVHVNKAYNAVFQIVIKTGILTKYTRPSTTTI